MNKILFICEGAKAEKKFCDLIIDKYFIKNNKEKEYIAFGTNIYGLYDEMLRDGGLDIVELVREKAKSKKDMYNYNKLSSGGFAEVYLIFDFDFQAPQYDYNKLIEMLKFFNNETENGKLYINYPMMESLKHFKSIPDNDYNFYQVTKEKCLTYKKDVSLISAINHYSDIDEFIIKSIIKQNLDKYMYITKLKLTSYDLYLNNFSQRTLLDYQLEQIKLSNTIYVLNTSIFWGIDYFGRNMYNKYIDNNINL